MLLHYGVESVGIKIDEKDDFDLAEIETPFIAHVDNNFAIVINITSDSVSYFLNNKIEDVLIEDFKQKWSGVILLAETNKMSIEPNYEEHRIHEWLNYIQKCAILVVIPLTICLFFVRNQLYEDLGLTLSAIVSLLGVYISFLLILKELKINNKQANKICSLLKHSDCDSVLNSKASKLFGIVGWSEIGLSYFISNAIIILICPTLISYLAFINILALPYSFWSIWYQKFKIKQWCPLCLIVQLLLWCVCGTNIIFGYISFPSFGFSDLVLTGIVYAIPFLAINMSLPVFLRANALKQETKKFNNLRWKEEVFTALYRKHHCEVFLDTSKIIFGNPDAKILITILTNPHCRFCMEIHNRMEEILSKTGNKLCVQYMFTSFGEQHEISSQFLIATYFNNEINKARDIYNQWFNNNKYSRDEFFAKFGYDLQDETIENELQKHKKWAQDNKINATPTIFINSYELPDEYEIEDILFFASAI
jgi:uncharacterized membrane protein